MQIGLLVVVVATGAGMTAVTGALVAVALIGDFVTAAMGAAMMGEAIGAKATGDFVTAATGAAVVILVAVASAIVGARVSDDGSIVVVVVDVGAASVVCDNVGAIVEGDQVDGAKVVGEMLGEVRSRRHTCWCWNGSHCGKKFQRFHFCHHRWPRREFQWPTRTLCCCWTS